MPSEATFEKCRVLKADRGKRLVCDNNINTIGLQSPLWLSNYDIIHFNKQQMGADEKDECERNKQLTIIHKNREAID